MKFSVPYKVTKENKKFFKTTQFAYYFGLTHLIGYFGFQWLGVPEMAWFNLLISSPAFIIALILNRLGRHNLAFGIAFFELFFHQVLATYYLGWNMGLYYLLIYLAGLSFFNPKWKRAIHVFILSLISISLFVLYIYFQEGVYSLEPEMVKMMHISGLIGTIVIIAILINGYSTSAHKAEKQLQEKNGQIQKQNEQIIQSINYAERIQHAIIPNSKILEENFADYFISFKPKDIVSGDFYWFSEVDKKQIIVCADCTGHGVPGAFMSMLGISFLNEIVNQKQITEANEILEKTRHKVKHALSQKHENTEQKDGIDMSVCVFDKEKNQMTFAGANNGIFIIRNNELKEYKPTKNPVGTHIKEIPFEKITIDVEKNDLIYMYSDGYIDQFGGDNNRKLLRKNFKRIVLDNANERFETQQKNIETAIEKWKGQQPQTDDCTLIGIKI